MDVREEWDKFGGFFLISLETDTTQLIDFSGDENRLWKAAWFIYFFGSFYKHNGEKGDEGYVQAAYVFLHQVLGFVDTEPFDFEGFFFKAFPK